MAGMTEEGLTILRQGEVLQELRNEAVPIFQDLVPADDTLDTSNSSTIGRLTGLLSIPLSDLWEAVQEVYLQFDPNSAYGVGLDNLVAYGGLTRNPATATTVSVVMWGTPNLVLNVGDSQVRSTDGNIYDLITPVTFSGSLCSGVRVSCPEPVNVGTTYRIELNLGNTETIAQYTAIVGDTSSSVLTSLYNTIQSSPIYSSQLDNDTLVIEAVDFLAYISVNLTGVVLDAVKVRTELVNSVAGEIEQPANTVNIIATPILGWQSVNNPFPGVTGRDEETDEELRLRFRDSKFLRAQNIADALYSNLLEIDGVISASIYENETDDYVAEFDLPGHSFRVVILGGTQSQIANVIWNNKPLGISSEGNTIVQITDSQGFPRDIRFDRPDPVSIEIQMEISETNGTFPSDGETRIKNALVAYFQDSMGVGTDVIYSRLYTPINTVPGHQVNSLQIRREGGTFGESNIIIDYNEIATLSSDDITITIV